MRNWSLEQNTIRTIKQKLRPMTNLESVCSCTGSLGGGKFWPKSGWKFQKQCFFDRSRTNNIALPVTTGRLLCLFCKNLKGVIFLIWKKKIFETTNNSGALWNLDYLTRKNPLGWGNKIISEEKKHLKILNKFFSNAVKN